MSRLAVRGLGRSGVPCLHFRDPLGPLRDPAAGSREWSHGPPSLVRASWRWMCCSPLLSSTRRETWLALRACGSPRACPSSCPSRARPQFVALPGLWSIPPARSHPRARARRGRLAIFHLPSSIFHLRSSIFHLRSSIFHLRSSIFHRRSSTPPPSLSPRNDR